jgi:hypothetical protein
MSSRQSVRSAMKWGGWLCLFLGFLPYYHREELPPSRPLPAGAIRAQGDVVSLAPPESFRTKFRIGLPFSPWFDYSKEAIYTPLAADAYRSNIHSEGRINFPNWSSALAGAGVALLGGRWLLRKA